MKAPRYKGLRSKSANATAAAKGSSRKRDTQCEMLLRKALWGAGLRYRLSATELPGRPDIVFKKAKVVVFVDGDFWHGRHLKKRLRQLARGHNSAYWTQKLLANVTRDRRVNRKLRGNGWQVMRFWEGDVKSDSRIIASRILKLVRRCDRRRK